MKVEKSSPKKEENTVGKGEIARYEQFLLFPQYFFFSKDLYCRHVKQGLVWERVTPLLMYVPNIDKKGHNAFYHVSCYQIMDL